MSKIAYLNTWPTKIFSPRPKVEVLELPPLHAAVTSTSGVVRGTVMNVSAWLPARISQKPYGRTSPNFLCMLTVAVVRPSSGGLLALRYVMYFRYSSTADGMTSCFHIMGPKAVTKTYFRGGG